jgi:hypothetical protein
MAEPATKKVRRSRKVNISTDPGMANRSRRKLLPPIPKDEMFAAATQLKRREELHGPRCKLSCSA